MDQSVEKSRQLSDLPKTVLAELFVCFDDNARYISVFFAEVWLFAECREIYSEKSKIVK